MDDVQIWIWLGNHWFEIAVLVLLVVIIVQMDYLPSRKGVYYQLVILASGLEQLLEKLEKLDKLENIKDQLEVIEERLIDVKLAIDEAISNKE